MAGRGRGMTLPAWMTKSENGGAADYPAAAGDASQGGLLSKGDSQGSSGKYDDAPQQSYDAPARENKENNKERDDDRGGRRDRDRSSDRSRDRRRSRSRSRERSRRSRRSRSRSGSRTPPRRRKKASNFDVPPTGMTLESAKAADLLNQSAILQQQPPQQVPQMVLPQQPITHAPPVTPFVAPSLVPNLAATLGGLGMGMAAANMQQTRHARRLYVGGITETSDYELREFFNDVIVKALDEPQEGGAVVSVYINADRHFAFVELKSIELTTACVQQLDGITFKGQPVKIRRPTDYQPHLVPPSTLPIPRLNLSKLGIIGTTVPDGPDKIFIGGLPYNLTVEQVKELLSAFGPLKAFHLVTDSHTGQSKGYAFCEYEDSAIGPVACQHLNGMRLGDKTLTVRIAMSQTEAKTAQAAAGSVNSALSLGLNPGLGGVNPLGTMSGLGAQAALSFAGVGVGGLGAGIPMPPAEPATRVLVLENMVTEEELRDDQEYEEIVDDVRGEVSKYGTVNSISIPRPPGNSSVGKIFVEYAAAPMAEAASRSLRGRQFGGRAVKTSFYDEAKFAAQNLE